MNFDLKENTILLTVAGSRAYGMSTAESDVDLKGICIPTQEYRDGFLYNFEQADKASHMETFFPNLTEEERKKGENGEVEGSIYAINKFFKLASQNNPNILDVLFCRDEDVRITSSKGQKLREHADDFLSTKCRWTFGGYARSQLKRINTHRKWLLDPPKKQPDRKDFGLPERTLIPANQLQAAQANIQKKLDSWEIDFGRLDESEKIYIKSQLSEKFSEMKLSDEAKYIAASRLLGYDENFIHLLDKERKYRAAAAQFKQYQTWKKERNKKRAELEAKFGYDCYSEDTEFLTEDGWKKFDEIDKSEKLATVNIRAHNKFGQIEYQTAIDRFDGVFNGELYNLFGYHVNTLVTPNHKMLIRKVERKSGKKFNWKLCEAAHLPDMFEIMMAPQPKSKNYKHPEIIKNLPIKPEPFMRLAGWFLSDGTCNFRKGKIKSINISQKKGGKLCQSMTKFSKKYKEEASCSLYKYINKGKNNSFRKQDTIEYILSVRNKHLRYLLYKEFGHSFDKKIPLWVFSLSKRLKDILLDAMMLGDGTARKFGSLIYYSSSKTLANDVQRLAMSCGYETSLYGPYDNNKSIMYQVHVNKNASRYNKLIRSQNIKKISVQNKRIVCFTVPNGVLITRRNGHIGIHGNSKHGSHLVRLFRMCREILEDGKVNVYRDDADELLAIRRGEWSYDKLMLFVEDEESRTEKALKATKLRKKPDLVALDKLCCELVRS